MIFAVFFSKLFSFVLFIVILCGVIAIHELGHLLVAKKFKVYCYEYSIGFGKAIYKNTKHETHFCLRIIPLGGYVKMAGEEGIEEEEEVLDNNSQPLPKDRILGNIKKGPKILVMAAGGIMNMLLAFICFFIMILNNGLPYKNYISPIPDSLLAENGVEEGAMVYTLELNLFDEEGKAVNKKPYVDNKVKNYNDISAAISDSDYTPKKEGQSQTLTITYKNPSASEIQELTVTRTVVEYENAQTYKYDKSFGLQAMYKDYNFFEAFGRTFTYMGEYFIEICKAFGKIFTGNINQLAGMVGIFETVDQVAHAGNQNEVVNIITLVGALSFSLGFFNLMPFPALDGGRIFFVLVEAVTRKKVNPKVEATIHTVGLFLLFGLMIIVNINDIIRIIAR